MLVDGICMENWQSTQSEGGTGRFVRWVSSFRSRIAPDDARRNRCWQVFLDEPVTLYSIIW